MILKIGIINEVLRKSQTGKKKKEQSESLHVLDSEIPSKAKGFLVTFAKYSNLN